MTIPASTIVNVNPGVVVSGGNPLALNGLFLTQNLQMPTGAVYAFASLNAVINFFGAGSAEAVQAAIYFSGFSTSSVKPGLMLFAAFNLAARAAYLQSGSLAGLSLNALKALSGVLTVTQDGVVKTSTSINLSAATSFSNAATIIAAAFTGGPAVAWNAVNSTFTFTSPTTGASSSMSFATGSLAAGLALTQALGALTSQGAVLDTPASAMTNAVNVAQNWISFVTLWEPALADKQAFALWSSGQNNRYVYLAWDTDANASVQGSNASFGAIARDLQYDGTVAISGDAVTATAAGTTLAATALATASFVSGSIASIDFSQKDGRTTLAFRSQGGLIPTTANQQLAANLIANGYSYYGAFATPNQGFVFFYNGQMSGKFEWLDTFVDEVWLNSNLQLALMNLITQVGSIAYNPQGYGLIRAALIDPITAGLNFGAIRTGVALSASQIAQVNQSAGQKIDQIISTVGYFLQILDPGATARGNRDTPIVNFWYADGGSIQKIQVSSVDIL